MERFDYIVVGAGSAGCVLARRLTRSGEHSVLLLEAGPEDDRREIRVPAAFPSLFKTEVDWDYATVPQPALDDRRIYWPRGKVLGGSSSINAQIHVRGNPADFDGWARGGAPGWSWEEVLPWFRRSEDHRDGGDGLRGTGGPLPVSDLRDPHPATLDFVEAVTRLGLGLRRLDDVNGPRQEGVAVVRVNQRRGSRASAASAYLRPARSRDELEVRTRCRATRVLFEGRRAVGVEYVAAGDGPRSAAPGQSPGSGAGGAGSRSGDHGDTGGPRRTVRARREVILACGAVSSPQLLLLSGVGPEEELRRMELPVVHDLPGVGRNLQDHLAAGVVMATRRPESLLDAESVTELLRYLFLRKGKLTSNIAEGVAFLRTDPALEAPDLELIFAPVPYIDHGLTRPPGHGFTVGAVLLQPESRGRLTLASPDPLDPPRIDPRYLSDPGGRDLGKLVEGVRLARRVFGQEPLASRVTGPMLPGPEVGEEELPGYVRRRADTLYHPVGTCRMGTDGGAVVDPELRVRGVEGLRVVDASVMPRIVRGHTNAATMMIAEKASELILERGAGPGAGR